MTRRTYRLAGAALGALTAAAWWWGYACTTCDAGGSPVPKLILAVTLGVGMGHVFGADVVREPLDDVG